MPVSDDDLTKPLGAARKRRFNIPAIPAKWVSRGVGGAMGALILFVAARILLVDDPYGGEPMAIVSMGAQAKPTASDKKPEETTADAKPGAPPAATPAASGQTIHDHRRLHRKPAGGRRVAGRRQEAGRQDCRVSEPGASVDPKLLEIHAPRPDPQSRAGRRARRRCLRQRRKAAGGQQDWPRVAIVVEGLGIGANTTSEALAKLPAQISFSFIPYGTDLDRWVSRARAGPRDAGPDRHGAVRLSRQRSGPADAAHLDAAGEQCRPAAVVLRAARRATSASPA